MVILVRRLHIFVSSSINLDYTFQVTVVVELFSLDFIVQIAQWGIYWAVIYAAPNVAGYVDLLGNRLCFSATTTTKITISVYVRNSFSINNLVLIICVYKRIVHPVL